MKINAKSFNDLKTILSKLENERWFHINIPINNLVFRIKVRHNDFTYFVNFQLWRNENGIGETWNETFPFYIKINNKWIWNGWENVCKFILKESKNKFNFLYNECYTKKT